MKIASSIVAFLAAAVVQTRVAVSIDVGDTIPSDLTLHHGFPPESISLDDRLSGKNVPGYLANQKALIDLGVDDIIVYCVNDGAVMAAWAEDQGVKCLEDSASDPNNILHLFADPYGQVTESLDMEMTASGPKMVGLLNRSKRFALYVVNGTVQIARVAEAENDPAGDDRPDITLAEAMIEAITFYNTDKKASSSDEL